MPVIQRRCSKCSELKPLKTSYYINTGNHKPYRYCKKCHADIHTSNPRNRLYASSRLNSRRKGIEHSIKLKDIPLPETCKYLGIKIDYRRASERGRLRSWDAPSIDRIDPTRGYVPGNIQVLSDLANRMKSDATVEQLVAFAQGVLAAHG